MIPFLEQPCLEFGPLRLCAFGLIVAMAVLVGLGIGRRRFARRGLEHSVGDGLAWYAVAAGFLGAHLFSVLFYFPNKVAENPLVLLKLWEDISSFGGILGGLVGLWLFLRFKATDLNPLDRWEVMDVAAIVFPIALTIGRIACSLAHDHPGTITTFPLAVGLETADAQQYISRVYAGAGRLSEVPPTETLMTMGFHDLGWYEFLYLALVAVPAMVLLDRHPRRPGFFIILFIGLYMPVRFLFDFLRVGDRRHLGLTPAQWGCLAALTAIPVLISVRPARRKLKNDAMPDT